MVPNVEMSDLADLLGHPGDEDCYQHEEEEPLHCTGVYDRHTESQGPTTQNVDSGAVEPGAETGAVEPGAETGAVEPGAVEPGAETGAELVAGRWRGRGRGALPVGVRGYSLWAALQPSERHSSRDNPKHPKLRKAAHGQRTPIDWPPRSGRTAGPGVAAEVRAARPRRRGQTTSVRPRRRGQTTSVRRRRLDSGPGSSPGQALRRNDGSARIGILSRWWPPIR